MRRFLFLPFLFCCFNATSQQAAYTDPAEAYVKLVLDNQNNPNEYTRIGTFKVKGTQMLYGGKQQGSVFTPSGSGNNVTLSYDTYYQQLQIAQGGQNILLKDCKEVDSFSMTVKIDEVEQVLNFINASQLKPGSNFFLQKVVPDGRFRLYKKYTSELGYISTNYIEPGLRQFNLNYEYYYIDTAKNELKKLKPNINSIVKEFKQVKDVSPLLDKETFNFNPEAAIVKVFTDLNQR
jgi:hypothetical protein